MSKVSQETAFHYLVNTNRNIFLTGAGGTGKTKLINDFVQHCRQQNISIALTASTGVAADLIGGTTIHTLLGLGADKEIEEILESRWYERNTIHTIRSLDVLIIDEISMIGSKTFETICEILRLSLDPFSKPFGGLRVIVVGDFFQLPPVNDEFCFQTEKFIEADFKVLNLHKNYRSDNEEWSKLLRKIRTGTIDEDVKMFFISRNKKPDPDSSMTRIVSTNWEAKKINDFHYSKIKEPETTFIYSTRDPDGILTDVDIDQFFKTKVFNKSIKLKVGTRVMIKVNDTKAFNYVNGTIGEVVYIEPNHVVVEIEKTKQQVGISINNFSIEKKRPVVKDNNGKKEVTFETKTATILCLPLIYAYALTVHNTQGVTLDEADINLAKGFTEGQAYVAVSRVKNPNGVYLTGLPHPKSLGIDDRVKEFIKINIEEFTTEEEIF